MDKQETTTKAIAMVTDKAKDNPNRSSPDTEHPVWVLGLVGVAATTINTEGLFTVVDFAIGCTLVAILLNVDQAWSANHRFRLAYGSVAGLCIIPCIGFILSAIATSYGWSGGVLWTASTHPTNQGPTITQIDGFIFMTWFVASTLVYAWLCLLSRRCSS